MDEGGQLVTEGKIAYMGVDVEHGELDLKELGGEPTYICSNGHPSSHGTKIAGLITAATNNLEGIASLAPRAIILPIKLKVTGQIGNGPPISEFASVVKAIRSLRFELGKGQWDFEVPIANCCFSNNGTPWGIPRELAQGYNIKRDSKVNRRMYIASAGNSGENTKKYPAAYSRVLGVTGLTVTLSTDQTQGTYYDILSVAHIPSSDGASNYHPDQDIYPVSGIYQCRDTMLNSRGQSTSTSTGPNQTYYTGFSGTSASVPCVTALAFLLYDAKPTADWRDVYERIVDTRNDAYSVLNPPINGLIDYEEALNGWQ